MIYGQDRESDCAVEMLIVKKKTEIVVKSAYREEKS